MAGTNFVLGAILGSLTGFCWYNEAWIGVFLVGCLTLFCIYQFSVSLYSHIEAIIYAKNHPENERQKSKKLTTEEKQKLKERRIALKKAKLSDKNFRSKRFHK